MESTKPKVFIVSFLILSVVISSFTMILSELLSGEKNSSSNSADSNSAVEKDLATASSGGVFAEALPRPLSRWSNTINAMAQDSSGDSIVSNPNNMTEQFMARYANVVKDGNPDGPVPEDGTDNTLLALPTEDKTAQLIAQVTSGTSTLPIILPTVYKNINTIDKPTTEDGNQYLGQVLGILDSTLGSQDFKNSLDTQNPDISLITAGDLMSQQALLKVKELRVPKPYLSFHQSLLKYLDIQSQLTEAASRHSDDPLRAILAIQSAQKLTALAANDLKNETDNIKNINTKDWVGNRDNKWLSLVKIPTAQAFAWPAWDIINGPFHIVNSISNTKGFWDSIAKFILDGIVQAFIDQLITQFQNQTVAWIQGGGKPKFVTNWQQFLEDTADKAVGQALYKLDKSLCSNFGPLVTFYFQKVPTNGTAATCTLTQVGKNLEKFAKDFTKGGWISYREVTQPNGNFFGAMIMAHDDLVAQENKATGAATHELAAGAGFKGVKVCTHYISNTAGDTVSENCQDPKWLATASDTDKEMCAAYEGTNQKICDAEQNMTPGGSVAHAMFGAADYKIGRVIQAKGLASLVSALIDAAISRVIKEGLANLTGLFNNKPNTANATVHYDKYGYSTGPDQPYLNDDQTLAQDVATSSRSISQNVNVASTTANQVQNNIIYEQAPTALNNLELTKTNLQNWLDGYPGVVSKLDDTVSACSPLGATGNSAAAGYASDAAKNVNKLSDQKPKVEKQLTSVNTASGAITALGDNPNPQDVSQALNDQGINSTEELQAETDSQLKTLKGYPDWADAATGYCLNPTSTPPFPPNVIAP